MFYPAHLNLYKKSCLVIGSGAYAERRVISLYRCGANITLVGQVGTPLLTRLSQENGIRWQKRSFEAEDLDRCYLLVFIETEDDDLNSHIFHQAHTIHGISLVNVHDVISESTFAPTSLVNTEVMTISISTGGQSPALSRRIRQHVEQLVGIDPVNHLAEEEVLDNASEFTFAPSTQPPYYPVGLIVEGQRCAVISQKPKKENDEMQQRLNLLERCGAQRVPESSSPTAIDDVFLTMVEQSAIEKMERLATQPELVEVINQPNRSRFITPKLISDQDLMIGISARGKGTVEMAQIHAQLTRQFVSNGYGRFLDLLGSLRPTVSNTVPLAEHRQKFYNNLISHSRQTGSKQADSSAHSSAAEDVCCLGLGHLDCQRSCLFNAVRYQKSSLAHIKSEILVSE
ncbi:MAG: bifunctional precorrin-2 dehydrogenase/sirohydrochlorin ferrochelatase [Candidatus Poribacteria bacterium]|jgi:precorrin-2 dehydrogenase/sirohydrochlorin ferrochelatase|nr:bifunctional precorrin-2 dehydrogenase/sirohydrochlorin ferrochelatase [Candidatus Poribacteria bacterium]MDP6749218.1 bifunctional precorrin-2 dehydrogenase/sirohydrochlorin ferrochelatase [Candidatus Poribacteria bacterium]MDP6995533.1 bifunctional precorrin-2 dehydrogenase/sirohydrochlorin ferrochelatase [Candidatus Poribacteria bacterium]